MEGQTYEDFVASRVKWLGELPADLIHATVGIVGELIELRAAYSRDNMLEELGDIEFYSVHYQLAWQRYGIEKFTARPQDFLGGASAYEDSIGIALCQAGELLDFAKKMWVYRKPPAELVRMCELSYSGFRANIEHAHHLVSTSSGVLRANNEAKLRTRFPSGYSDAHAQMRLDKALDR